jgi:CRISPR/Cas system CSM-associated protein Csm3 (group 7 of RAMP superfamily)
MQGHHKHSREITERIHISGHVTLLTPAHFGNGVVRGDALVDMSLLLGEADSLPFIPGTTIAGALRTYLRTRVGGHRAKKDEEPSELVSLFGPNLTDEHTALDQSLLVIDDATVVRAEAQNPNYSITLRDGVRIDPKTNLVFREEQNGSGAKYDLELLEAGTTFELHVELLATSQHPADELLPWLVQALAGLETGEIRLGLRKRRGFGQVTVKGWRMSRYHLATPSDLCEWLETPAWGHRPDATPTDHVLTLAAMGAAAAVDHRHTLRLTATFGLADSSLLIRAGSGQLNGGVDAEHLHAHNSQGQWQPVIPGTSWAGVLRHRALRIANTVASAPDMSAAAQLIDDLFGWTPGFRNEEQGSASRLFVNDSIIAKGQNLYQTRVRIDRFTGGALDAHLFDEAPIYGIAATTVTLVLQVFDPTSADIGLLLLLLRDLWTQDLPVGGEASVGRGRLTGQRAELTLPDSATPITISAGQPDMGLDAAERQKLQKYVDCLWDVLVTPAKVQGAVTHA